MFGEDRHTRTLIFGEERQTYPYPDSLILARQCLEKRYIHTQKVEQGWNASRTFHILVTYPSPFSWWVEWGRFSIHFFFLFFMKFDLLNFWSLGYPLHPQSGLLGLFTLFLLRTPHEPAIAPGGIQGLAFQPAPAFYTAFQPALLSIRCLTHHLSSLTCLTRASPPSTQTQRQTGRQWRGTNIISGTIPPSSQTLLDYDWYYLTDHT